MFDSFFEILLDKLTDQVIDLSMCDVFVKTDFWDSNVFLHRI